jgi:hypothetical protein
MKYKILVLLSLLSAGHAMSQESHPLYSSGHFPPGHVYVESELDGLVDKVLPSPSYLTGEFVYLGTAHGQHVFSTFKPQGQEIAFGKTLIAVAFFNNVPPRLGIGTAISATPDTPLTVKSVHRSGDGFILVEAESQSAP